MTTEESKPYLDTTQFMLRQTVQYRWCNVDKESSKADKEETSSSSSSLPVKYANFDGYLNSFKSKRRIQIKRERSVVYNEEVLLMFLKSH